MHYLHARSGARSHPGYYAPVLQRMENFRTRGELRGNAKSEKLEMNVSPNHIHAWQREEWRSILDSDHVLYVVKSYKAAIAFAVLMDEETQEVQWYVPDIRYTTTTTRHQNKIRRALEYAGIEYAEYPMPCPTIPFVYKPSGTPFTFTWDGGRYVGRTDETWEEVRLFQVYDYINGRTSIEPTKEAFMGRVDGWVEEFKEHGEVTL